MTESVFPYSLDTMFNAMGTGSLDRALTNNLYGINHMQNPGMLKSNKDHQGFVFMTRPQLNLQKDNIRNYRELYPLLDDDPSSLGKAIRMLLDPRLGAGYNFRKYKGQQGRVAPISSNLIDNNQAFIPMITNNTITVTGWPDEAMTTSSTDPGLHKQVYVLADGIARNYGEVDLSFNTQNVSGDPLSMLLHAWIHYQGAIKENRMQPYFDHIMGDRVDYQSRVYRVVLNQHKTHMTKISAVVAGFPISNPTGMFSDFNRETPYSEQTKEITFRFKAMGYIPYDPLLIDHFNRTVAMFNPGMKDSNRENSMELLKIQELRVYNHRAYPRIDPNTLAMEWWIPKNLHGTKNPMIEIGEGMFTGEEIS